MKKLLTIILILLCLFTQAGVTPGRIVRALNATTAFGTSSSDNIPIATKIIDVNTGKEYNTLQPILYSKTIATCSLVTELKEMSNPIPGTAGNIQMSDGTSWTSGIFPEVDPVVKSINGFVVSDGTTIQAAVSGSDIKTINSTSLLGAGNIITGDVSKVGTPINNQIGIWTGSETIKGGTNFTYDGAILSMTGTSGNGSVIKMTDIDYPNDYFFIRNTAHVATFWQRIGSSNNLSFTADQYGITQGTLVLNDPGNYRDVDGEIRYNGSDFYGKKAGTWVSLTASAGSGMTNPMTTTGDIVYASATGSPATPARLAGGISNNGKVLTVVSGIPSWQTTTSGSSQWTTDTYGVTYGSNVGLGVASGSSRFAAQSSTSGQFTGTFYNSSPTGGGVSVSAGNISESSWVVKNYSGATSFNVTGDGSVFMPRITNVSQAYVLGYDASTKSVSYFATPSGGGSGSTNLSYTSATTYGRVNSSTGSYATIPAVTTSIAGLMTTTDKTNLNTVVSEKWKVAISANAGAGNYIDPSYFTSTSAGWKPIVQSTQTSGSDIPFSSGGAFTQLNLKQNSLTLTTTGSSGAATLVGATLNIPQYAGGGSMTYPGVGIPISTGSAWGTSIPDASTNWNTAYTNSGKVKIVGGSTAYNLSDSYFTSTGSGIYPLIQYSPTLDVTLPVSSDGVYQALLPKLSYLTDTLFTTISLSDETTDLTTVTAVRTFRMPIKCKITKIRMSVNTAPTGSTIIVDINESGTSILSTKLSIDATEKTSATASIPVVISDNLIADDAEIKIDIDQKGSTIAGSGLKVVIYYIKN